LKFDPLYPQKTYKNWNLVQWLTTQVTSRYVTPGKKGQRSRSQCHETYSVKSYNNSLTHYWVVLSSSYFATNMKTGNISIAIATPVA